MEFKNTFSKGIMNKDIDERLIPKGTYRHAENINISAFNDDSGGAIIPSVSTVLIKDYNLNNAVCIGSEKDESNDIIYYFITSDTRDMVIEYSEANGSSVVLEDTKGRLLNFNTSNLINGINIIHTEQLKYKQLSWTDGLNPPRKVYIETAKTYGLDGFDKYDILVVKRPPFREPSVSLYNDTSIEKNKIQNKSLLFAYRYIYEGYENSSISFYSKVIHVTSDTDINHVYNTVKIDVQTGDSRVLGIDILYKELYSNTVYIIDTITKLTDGVLDNSIYTCSFSKDKIYPSVSNNDVVLMYNNVPKLALHQDYIGDRLMYFNYSESYDTVIPDYTLSPIYYGWNASYADLPKTYVGSDVVIDFSGKSFIKDNIIRYEFAFNDIGGEFGDTTIVDYVVLGTYVDITTLHVDMKPVLEAMFLEKGVEVTVDLSGTDIHLVININNPIITSWQKGREGVMIFPPSELSYKSDYTNKFSLVYYDEFNRSGGVVSKLDNSLKFNDIKLGRIGNEIGKVSMSINHLAPDWAVKYKIVRNNNSYKYDISKSTTLYWFSDTWLNIDISGYYLAIYNDDIDKYKLDGILDYRFQYDNITKSIVTPPSDLRFRIDEIGVKSNMLPDIDDGADGEMGVTILRLTKLGTGQNDLLGEVSASAGIEKRYRNSYFYITNEDTSPNAIFYEIPETYDILNNEHQGNISNQNSSLLLPAVIQPNDGDIYFYDYKLEKYKYNDSFFGDKFENISSVRANAEIIENIENDRFASFTYSEPFTETTSYNGLSTFNLTLINYRDLDKAHGSIQLGEGRYGDIFIAQEHKLSTILFGRDMLSNSDGSGNIVSTTKLLGQQMYIPYDNGISTNPESFVRYDNFMIMTDVNRGEVIMIQGNKVSKISSIGMDFYFRNKMRSNSNSYYKGGFNPVTGEYLLTIDSDTVAFNIMNKGWSTFYSFIPDNYSNLNGYMYTFNNGVMYRHSDTSVYNTFYGTLYPSKIELIFNDTPSDIKIFKTLNIEGDTAWEVTHSTNITNGIIHKNEFVEKESEWYAYIRKNEDSLDTSSFSTQGIGNIVSILGNIFSFDSVSEFVNNGDSLSYYLNGVLYNIGTIISHTNNTITVDNISNTPVVGYFSLLNKNNRIEGSFSRGYYLNVGMELLTDSKYELYAVNTDTAKSFQ